ncbi:NAD-dependent epimerase/dehydratase family protein [Occultella gossypii]|uniref:NAD(P)-dependent oxidoreductase n=1 Tax=Occultella gossypii TaxID=2800820 RepID=A0ABS7SF71_9MICO|nr:NAD(P)-dependent oxidoreductase [Occultella gossypii]MBZ2197936.1 NAD(P)-dependent oxidoreductase [Occultella gossypii]
MSLEIAVTGAAGVLGRYVVRAVTAAGHRPRTIDVRADSGVDVRADLRDYEAAARALERADAVVHLAAHPKPVADRPGMVYAENTTMSFNVLSAAADLGIAKVVVASSINAIGGEFSEIAGYDRFPVDFEQASQARDEYSLSKWVMEQQVRYFGRIHGDDRSMVCLRIHAVQPREVQLGAYERSPDRGRRNLWGYSPPEQTAAALVRACAAPLPGVHFGYLVATDNAMHADPRELVRRHWPDTPCDGRLTGVRGLFDTSFAEAELGWGP